MLRGRARVRPSRRAAGRASASIQHPDGEQSLAGECPSAAAMGSRSSAPLDAERPLNPYRRDRAGLDPPADRQRRNAERPRHRIHRCGEHRHQIRSGGPVDDNGRGVADRLGVPLGAVRPGRCSPDRELTPRWARHGSILTRSSFPASGVGDQGLLIAVPDRSSCPRPSGRPVGGSLPFRGQRGGRLGETTAPDHPARAVHRAGTKNGSRVAVPPGRSQGTEPLGTRHSVGRSWPCGSVLASKWSETTPASGLAC